MSHFPECFPRPGEPRFQGPLSWLPSAFTLALAACLVASAAIGIVALVRLYVITGAAVESVAHYFRTGGAR